MVQMWLLWWPKNTTTPVKPHSAVTTSTDTVAIETSVPENGSCCCITGSSSTTTTTSSSYLSKLLRKLKKHSRSLCAAKVASRKRSFQCRYDPMSYSLNFDTSGCGNLLEDEDYYYQFCAFSSRYVTNTKSSSSPKMVATSH
ncbi:hypothetical protein ACOSQ2_013562 [Xanthoceras sorbifolium]|uniref:Uncharacterized protein n=1 Tax=Xanthoceras sorbifolium TaxID=99658 RepID=A0ABQ8HZ68_9ROSI|nr:hypothetical protein JRO89_XS06G0237900 [Xanthoceras sorbifolium]